MKQMITLLSDKPHVGLLASIGSGATALFSWFAHFTPIIAGITGIFALLTGIITFTIKLIDLVRKIREKKSTNNI